MSNQERLLKDTFDGKEMPVYRSNQLKWGIFKGFEMGNYEEMNALVKNMLESSLIAFSGLSNEVIMDREDNKLVVKYVGGEEVAMILKEMGDKATKRGVEAWLHHVANTALMVEGEEDMQEFDSIDLVVWEENQEGELIDAWLLKDVLPIKYHCPDQPGVIKQFSNDENIDVGFNKPRPGDSFESTLQLYEVSAVRGEEALSAVRLYWGKMKGLVE